MRRQLINPTGDSHQFIEFLYSHPSPPKSYNLDKRANLKCYDYVYLWLKAPVDLWRKKNKKKSHLGSPQDDTDKDVSICVQTLREIGWIASQWWICQYKSMLVIIQILAKTSRLLSDIHYRKWIVMQIIFVGYFCRNLAAVSLFT